MYYIYIYIYIYIYWESRLIVQGGSVDVILGGENLTGSTKWRHFSRMD